MISSKILCYQIYFLVIFKFFSLFSDSKLCRISSVEDRISAIIRNHQGVGTSPMVHIP